MEVGRSDLTLSKDQLSCQFENRLYWDKGRSCYGDLDRVVVKEIMSSDRNLGIL